MTSPPNQNRKTKQQRRAKPLPEDTSSLTWARERGEGNEVRHPPFSTCTLSLQAIIGPKVEFFLDTNLSLDVSGVDPTSKTLRCINYLQLLDRQLFPEPLPCYVSILSLTRSHLHQLHTNRPVNPCRETNFSAIGKPSKDFSVTGYKFLYYRQPSKDLSVTGYKFLHYRQDIKGPFSYWLQISPP
ncbi:hypothetical protein TNIN_17691 [Trichonephila inaurata madagascariensis]|uniref:Uncharacterized protein n=1 Tax=Trichonephila inaurata madagascariensis TaxID=2747483 RepID=A0A8X7C2N4_9ARAC|nr:hypothetical protein TNIN_17691 [Trichonephila inaurata madagascariensis]